MSLSTTYCQLTLYYAQPLKNFIALRQPRAISLLFWRYRRRYHRHRSIWSWRWKFWNVTANTAEMTVVYLNAFFLQIDSVSDFLAKDNIRVVRHLERFFQLLQLLLREYRSVPSLPGRHRCRPMELMLLIMMMSQLQHPKLSCLLA